MFIFDLNSKKKNKKRPNLAVEPCSCCGSVIAGLPLDKPLSMNIKLSSADSLTQQISIVWPFLPGWILLWFFPGFKLVFQVTSCRKTTCFEKHLFDEYVGKSISLRTVKGNTTTVLLIIKLSHITTFNIYTGKRMSVNILNFLKKCCNLAFLNQQVKSLCHESIEAFLDLGNAL